MEYYWEKRVILVFFIILLISIGIYVTIFANHKKSKDLNFKESRYYETFGESCLDRVTDDYLRNVCEKINNSIGRDACYYREGIATGYYRICKLIKNKILNQKCFEGVNTTLLGNKSLRQRAEKYDPSKRKI